MIQTCRLPFFFPPVILSHWDAGVSKDYPWEMVFEALLRCGGNLVIPGTDKNSKGYAPVASEKGLMVTHHHADLFEQLWIDAIERQKKEGS